MNKLLNSVSLAILALAMAGCTSAPVAMAPEEMPSAFAFPAATNAQEMPSAEWWKSFSNPELTEYIAAAHKDNLDLAVYAARVQQARANTGLAAASLFPSLDFSGSADRNGTKTHNYNTFGAQFSASYELDPWGKSWDGYSAARNSARSAIYTLTSEKLTITANVANAYLAVLSLRQRIDITKKNVEAAKRILKITEAKVKHGAESNLELAQQTATVASEEATLPQLEESEREERYALAILLGRVPEGFDVKGTSLDGIVVPPVQPGLPSSLLQQRPDIAAAEASLLAAHANLDAARAAFLPSISLSGTGGYSSSAISGLIGPGNLAWSLGASVLQSIFDGGKLTSSRDYYAGVETELVATYRSTVLSALSDVETELGSSASLAERERLITKQVENAQEAFRISELQYREGVTALLTVLNAQQTLFSAQDTLVQVKLARLQAAIGLYKALGGGWNVKAEEDTPTRNTFIPVPLPL